MVEPSDRQVLDRQLQDAIYQIEHAQGVVKAIDPAMMCLAREGSRRRLMRGRGISCTL